MKNKNRKLLSFILVIILLVSSFPALIVNATEYSEIKNNYNKYNCYAYAIGRFEETKFYWPRNEEFLRYHPSDIYKTYSKIYDSHNDDVYTLATIVQNDLIALGYSNISIYQSEGEDYNVNDDEINTYAQLLESICFDTQALICTRIEEEHDDYHFMIYDNKTNAWFNKHGYGAILKYTDNNGVPSNDEPWIGPQYTYYGNIAYIIYDKLQINVIDFNPLDQSITIKRGEDVFSGKDAFYEIVVPESGCYTIELQTPCVEVVGYNRLANFNYEIYSYNMYNGNYSIVSGSGVSGQTFTQTVNLTTYNDYNDGSEGWQYQAYKHYIRLDFGRENTSDETVNVSITRSCLYNDHYEQHSATQHKAYCECGEYVLEDHFIAMNFCQLCDSPHTHDYSDHYIPKTNSTHISYCICGSTSIQPHVVSAGAFSSGNKYAICLACGGTATTGIILHQAIGKLPRSENGSFILPNGVIVLADEDVEAYFDGRLEFIYPDDNLETE